MPPRAIALRQDKQSGYYRRVADVSVDSQRSRDAERWHLNRSERDVLELLAAFDRCSRNLTQP